MKVIITGSDGFIGKNLIFCLRESLNFDVISFNRDSNIHFLCDHIVDADLIVHLAGENRPEDDSQFDEVNAGLTKDICDAILSCNRKIPIIFSSGHW